MNGVIYRSALSPITESNKLIMNKANTVPSETEITDLIFEKINETITPNAKNINCTKSNVMEIIINIFMSKGLFATADAIKPAAVIKTTFVIINDISAAKSLEVIIYVRETGFVRRKSAVFWRTSLDIMDTAKFMA